MPTEHGPMQPPMEESNYIIGERELLKPLMLSWEISTFGEGRDAVINRAMWDSMLNSG